jgi:hypothetical protein
MHFTFRIELLITVLIQISSHLNYQHKLIRLALLLHMMKLKINAQFPAVVLESLSMLTGTLGIRAIKFTIKDTLLYSTYTVLIFSMLL